MNIFERKLHPDSNVGGGGDNEIEKEKIEELKSLIFEDGIRGVKSLLESYPLPEEKIQEAVYEVVKSLLSEGRTYDVKSLLESYALPEEKKQEAVYEGLKSLFLKGMIYSSGSGSRRPLPDKIHGVKSLL